MGLLFNYEEIDASEKEAKLKEKVPDLLYPGENVLLAYKCSRDSYHFTQTRILQKDKKGISGKRTDYKSFPYTSIRAYAIETAGSLDTDSELKVYLRGVGRIDIDFKAGTVDIFKLQRFLDTVVLVGDKAGKGVGASALSTTSVPPGSGKTSFFDLIGDNASQIDPKQMELALKSDQLLIPEESVEFAFKCGRDSFVMTSHRILQIDVQGISGRRIEYFTLLWPTVKAFSVETAGNFFDRDAELVIFTNIPDRISTSPGAPRRSRTRIGIDFRKGRVDLMAVERFFSDKILGTDNVDPSTNAVSMAGQVDTGSGNIFSWLGNDSRMIDAKAVDDQYHCNPPLLQNCEHVEMAFKGRRDLLLLTSKRVVFVDMKGWGSFGKKVEYVSIPYTTVTAFGVRSAGSLLDKDSEMLIWTDFDDAYYPPEEDDDQPPPPPIPRRSFLEIDFQKDRVDLMAVHRYLSERCLRIEGGHVDADCYHIPNLRPFDMPVSPDVMSPTPPGALEKILNFIGQDAVAIDPATLDAQFHGETRLFQPDEKVIFAYKTGRDTLVFSNKRIFIIDVQGFSGKRIQYNSFPYHSVRGFSIETAGSFDRDTELAVWLKCYWMDGYPSNAINQDLRKGRSDVVALQAYLCEQVIGAQDGRTVLEPGRTSAEAGTVASFLGFLKNDGVATDHAAVEKQLKTAPKILQNDEKVEACYKVGRDLICYTTKRILVVNVQGITGKKVSYDTLPLRYCQAFKVTTAGNLLSEAKAKVYCEGCPDLRQDLSKSSSDIWGVQKILAYKMLH